MVKRRTKRKRMVRRNLLLAFFTDKIRLGIRVYSQKHFLSYVEKKYFGNFVYSHIFISHIMAMRVFSLKRESLLDFQ